MSLLILLRSTAPAVLPVQVELDEIVLRNEFEDPRGEFHNYDAYDDAQLAALKSQKHINIRSFEQYDVTTRIPMLYLDLLSINTLNTLTMEDIGLTTFVRAGERWTNGIVSKDPARNNWQVLSMPCVSGLNTTISAFAS